MRLVMRINIKPMFNGQVLPSIGLLVVYLLTEAISVASG